MTTERHALATLRALTHPLASRVEHDATCSCGQELDTCTGRHCPRCGTSLRSRAA